MSDTDDLVRRIETLEMHVAYQDQTIEELNSALADQWKTIEALQRRFDRLVEEVREAELSARDGQKTEPPPPHY